MKYTTPELKWLLSTADAIMASVEEPPVDIPEEDLTDFNDKNPNVLGKGHVNLF